MNHQVIPPPQRCSVIQRRRFSLHLNLKSIFVILLFSLTCRKLKELRYAKFSGPGISCNKLSRKSVMSLGAPVPLPKSVAAPRNPGVGSTPLRPLCFCSLSQHVEGPTQQPAANRGLTVVFGRPGSFVGLLPLESGVKKKNICEVQKGVRFSRTLSTEGFLAVFPNV